MEDLVNRSRYAVTLLGGSMACHCTMYSVQGTNFILSIVLPNDCLPLSFVHSFVLLRFSTQEVKPLSIAVLCRNTTDIWERLFNNGCNWH